MASFAWEIFILQILRKESLCICCEIVLNLYLSGSNIQLNGMSKHNDLR